MRSSTARRMIATIVVLVVVAGGLWAGWQRYSVVPIGRILDRPDAYDGKLVNVKGRVDTGFAVLGAGFLQLSDDTGTLWVTKRGSVPTTGATVRLRGRVNPVLQVDRVSVVGLEVVP